MPSEVVYTPVQLCTYNDDLSKQWFVYFDITDKSTGITVRKQFRGAINYHRTLEDRLMAGMETKKYWEARLKHGWSQFLYSGSNQLSRLKFNEALDWALSKCVVADKTRRGYAGMVEYFKKAAITIRLDKAIITGIKKQHIKLLLDQIKKDRSWSNNAYNKGSNYISGVFARLVEYEIIEHNPAHNIKQLAVAETNKFETITDEEKIIIRDYLTRVHPSFFTYLMLIYHTGIRPKECLALKVSDIFLPRSL